MQKPAVLLFVAFLTVQVICAQTELSAAPNTENRIALVIGNSAYANVPLKNPANDARDFAAVLEKLGFSVNLVLDGDMAAMSRSIRDFGNAIKRPDAVALFYYSGHGVQYRGANYLIPAKSDIQDPDELSFSAVNADQVYAKMESSGDKMNIVILDACRNNPFPGAERASERGLAIVGNVQPPQSVIVYATAPGKTAQDGTGRNGVFTSALLRHIGDPGLDIELMIRRVREDVIAATGGAQVPWNNSSISGSGFVFAPSAQEKPAAPAALAAALPSASTGRLSIMSDPPGIQVSVDGAAPLGTPLSLDLPPGAHSIEPLVSTIDRKYFAAEQKQWITVVGGMDVAVPLQPKRVEGKLLLRLVPPGYSVYVDDQMMGDTPLPSIEVDAGYISVRFERTGERPREFFAGVPPDGTATISWGEKPETAVQLETRTIKLDGKPDTWGEVEPVYETDKGSFMGEAKYGISRIYMCKDEKYLYWRVDFQETNPFREAPKGAVVGIAGCIDINFDAGKTLSIGLNTNKKDVNKFPWMTIWDDRVQKSTKLSQDISYDIGKSMLVGRVALAKIAAYCRGPSPVDFKMANQTAKTWESQVQTRMVYVDFSK